MQRRVPVQTLRGSDATLLEVQLQNLLRRPMGQLAPENVLDLLALAEAEGRPKSVAKQLEQFVERCGNELADMPPIGFAEFLAETEGIPSERFPQTFRDWLAREAARNDRDTAAVQVHIDRIATAEPEPFTLGETAAKVQRPEPKASATGTKKAGAKKKKRRPAAPKLDVGGAASPEKRKTIEKICMERLNGATDTGLSELVLVAGVRHRAKTEGFGDVTPSEVTAALRGLKNIERVRYSAGRWMSTARRW